MTYNEKDYDKMLWYILNNTPEVEPFIEICRTELESAGNVDVDRALAKEFAGWFNKHLATRKFVHGEEVNEDLYALASEPHLRVHLFSGCLVNGVRYHTLDRERSRKTQNSGVMVEGSHNGGDIDLYGQLKEIIQLQYNSDSNSQRTVVLFQCNWFDTCSKKSRIKDDGHFKSVSHGSCWYKDDPFIFATQATKVFYLEDNKHGEPWKVVQKFSHRHLWNVPEEENDDLPAQAEHELSYQDDEQENTSFQVADLERASINEQPSNYEDGICVQASLVDQIQRERELEVEENGFEDDADETVRQYDSENEGPIHDDGEYSDFE
ncbi:hypothetical protein OsJ_06036 [Oryza sativa Japonica Group]|nr:hypothetical protein OsJ_06036 [Oryza sativa Japonica Group]